MSDLPEWKKRELAERLLAVDGSKVNFSDEAQWRRMIDVVEEVVDWKMSDS